MAKDGDVKALRELVAREGAQTLLKREEMDVVGSSALYCAAAYGHLSVLEYLWEESGVGPQLAQMVDDYGWTPLMLAAGDGRLRVVECVLADERRCPPEMVRAVSNGRDYYPQSTALHYVAANGHEAVVRLLATRFTDAHSHGLQEGQDGGSMGT
eukprot:EC791987.1.p1 GENE.EC791987.1~~EC791987.1.p1  ORF type:complete len:155 (+),score=40.82 EC791987.1:142-606(+)